MGTPDDMIDLGRIFDRDPRQVIQDMLGIQQRMSEQIHRMREALETDAQLLLTIERAYQSPYPMEHYRIPITPKGGHMIVYPDDDLSKIEMNVETETIAEAARKAFLKNREATRP